MAIKDTPAMISHEQVMEPLCGIPTALEVAKAYIEAVQKRAPRYDYQLGRALDEIDLALKSVKQTQVLAIELWRNNHHASG